MQTNTANNTLSLDEILHTIGRPLNHAARTQRLSQGDPIYFVTHLPYQELYPLVAKHAPSEAAFAQAWSDARATIEAFYAASSELQEKPIWAIDELALNRLRDDAVDEYLAANPEVVACYLDRASGRSDMLQLDVNRTLVAENGHVARTDSPSILAGRPGTPSISEQIQAIAQACMADGTSKLLLADSGFASGNSILQICKLLEAAGLQIVKVMGSIGSTKSRDVLQAYDPVCIIWFDLQRSGWVESRDFFMFLNTGTPIATAGSMPDTYNIITKPLPGGPDIGFAVPYIAYGGRWFRLGTEPQIRQLASECFAHTQRLYDSLKEQLTITELATFYAEEGQPFLLPVNFGDLTEQYQAIDPAAPVNTYLTQQFQQFVS